MKIEIAGIPLALSIKNKDLCKAAMERYKAFLSDARPVLSIEVESINKIKKTDRRVKTKAVLNDGILCIKHSEFLADIDTVMNKGRLFTGSSIYHLDSFLRVLYSSLLIMDNGMLVHACGAAKQNSSAVFSGLSCSGKTTIARFFPQDRVLSDEVVALKRTGRRWYAYSTPFWGEMKAGGKPVRSRLKKIYLLKRGKKFRTEMLGRKNAIGCFMRNLIFFLKGGEEKCLDVVNSLLKNVPACNFYFSPSMLNRRRLDELIG